MRIRPEKFYIIKCRRKDDLNTVEIEDADSQGIAGMLFELFQYRLSPSRDDSGKCKKVPYTMLSVIECNNRTMRNREITHCNVYNLSPSQVKERILDKIVEYQKIGAL